MGDRARRRSRRRVAAPLLGLLGLAVGAACAGDVVRANGLYRHRQLGWEIAAPTGPDGYWKPAAVAGADLAFQGGRGEHISLTARCGRALAPAWVLARHLLIGIPDHRLRASGRLESEVGEGWVQIFDARAKQGTVRVKTVTRVAGECSYDWVLAAREGFEESEPGFDAWWRSFQPPAPSARAERAW